MNNFRFGSILAVVMPLALAVVLGMMCMGQYNHRKLAMQAEQEQQANVASLENMIKQLEVAPLTNKVIAADATPDEQAAFLTQLRVNAAEAHVKMVQYTNMGVVMPPASEQDKAPQTMFRPVASNLAVSGSYAGVRAFAYSLLRANRLMNMNGVTWKRDNDRRSTTLSFTLIRYVTDPAVQVTTQPVAMRADGPSGGDVR